MLSGIEIFSFFVSDHLNGKDCSVRLILVYGPQKNDSEEKDSLLGSVPPSNVVCPAFPFLTIDVC